MIEKIYLQTNIPKCFNLISSNFSHPSLRVSTPSLHPPPSLRGTKQSTLLSVIAERSLRTSRGRQRLSHCEPSQSSARYEAIHRTTSPSRHCILPTVIASPRPSLRGTKQSTLLSVIAERSLRTSRGRQRLSHCEPCLVLI